VDNGEIQTQFGVKGYPTLFLVNQEKQNVANNLELDKLIDAIAKELNLPLEDFADLKSEVAEMMAGVPH
jgi:cell division septum initiation protein DivIVA